MKQVERQPAGAPIGSRTLLRRFAKDSNGAVALEFVILAPLFLMTLFAIFECSILLGAQQVLSNATEDIGRQIRVGDIRPEHLTETTLDEMLCDRMPALFPSGCPGLMVDVRNFNTLEEAANEFDKGIVPATFKVDIGPALSNNVMRVFYRWPAILTIFTDSVVDPATGYRLLFATTTWQSEPFPDG